MIDVSIRRQSAHGGRMSSAMTYSFWGLGMLAMGGIVLATLVW